jgi:large subunit ribosomal protein L13
MNRMAFCSKNSLKSSDFLTNKRVYENLDYGLKDPMVDSPLYDPPEHLYKPPNDEHMRMALPKTDAIQFLRANNIIYENYIEPQSAYFAVRRNGITYHVFDASRIPLGRMATKAAMFLMGKHKPTFDPKRTMELGDKIIVVNGGDIKVTGRKRYQMIFRSHTQYAGGLKEILFKDLMEKDPQDLVRRVIKGMLPRNRTRKFLLERITVHKGQYHNHQGQHLPQFINQPLPDPNKLYGTIDMDNLQNYKIVYESNPEQPLEEFKDVERDYDENLTRLYPHYLDEYREDPRNRKIEKKFEVYKSKLKRYKEYK